MVDKTEMHSLRRVMWKWPQRPHGITSLAFSLSSTPPTGAALDLVPPPVACGPWATLN